ncbi:MAG: helix-turn-helix transcriptional regulator [Arcobacter butzleri]|jgi:DNA-binding XRE family transcriptional regulator|nr:helix-turn-helix domain-containing protein [Arcobacteraceae bacterium]MDY0365824.1 helix-turn-helix transcriptional regulator [Arcobacteraceae bacterium]NLO17854.1 helix-turn-helix transcriptional regulator [Aliarcobacter butzleri]
MAKVVKLSEKPTSQTIASMQELGKHIKYQRTKLGLTRENTASICGINHQTLANIENGNDLCSAGNLFYVAKMLGIKLNVKIEDE